jgi:hypothetical protein
LETRIDVYDYAAIVKNPVMYQITNGELRPGDIGYGSHMLPHAVFAALTSYTFYVGRTVNPRG